MKLGGQKVPTRALLLILSDGILIVAALWLAIVLRLLVPGFSWAQVHTIVSIPRFGAVVVACLIPLYYYDLYDFQLLNRRSLLMTRLLTAMGTSSLILGVLYYIAPELGLGRGIMLLAAPILVIMLLGWRLSLDSMPSWRRSEKLLVVGTGETGISVVREVVCRPELNMKVVGFIDEKGENIGKSLVNPGIVGGLDQLESLAEQHDVHRVVLSLKDRRGAMPVQSLLRLKFKGVAVEDAHSLHERITGQICLPQLSPSWLILSDGFRTSRLRMSIKRVEDIVFSVLALLVASPLMLIVGLAIWLEDGGPVLYRQTRIGSGRKPFEILKFRSMRNSHQEKPRWTADGDSRITRVGRHIRRYRLDELPQFFNVLRGEMSIVGPRPEQPYFASLLEDKIPYYAQRYSVPPGITGWAQIKYTYGASVDEARTKLEYDLFYIKHISLPLDLAILLETAKVLLSGRGAK